MYNFQRRTNIVFNMSRQSLKHSAPIVDFETFSTPALSKIVLLVDEGFFINSHLILEIARVQTDFNLPLWLLTRVQSGCRTYFLIVWWFLSKCFAMSNVDRPIPSSFVIVHFYSEPKSPFEPKSHYLFFHLRSLISWDGQIQRYLMKCHFVHFCTDTL